VRERIAGKQVTRLAIGNEQKRKKGKKGKKERKEKGQRNKNNRILILRAIERRSTMLEFQLDRRPFRLQTAAKVEWAKSARVNKCSRSAKLFEKMRSRLTAVKKICVSVQEQGKNTEDLRVARAFILQSQRKSRGPAMPG